MKRARPALIIAVLALTATMAATALARSGVDTSKPAQTIANEAGKRRRTYGCSLARTAISPCSDDPRELPTRKLKLNKT